MRNTVILPVVVFLLFQLSVRGQTNMTVQLRAYDEYGKRMKEVGYTIERNNKKFSSRTERKGIFQFFIQPEDSFITVTANKGNYRTKEIVFPANAYDFSPKYAVQEIDLMFEKGDENNLQKGQLKYVKNKYMVEAVETKIEEQTEELIEEVTEVSIAEDTSNIEKEVNPDFIATKQPDDQNTEDTFQEEFNFENSESNEYFSIQIGAFSNKVKESAFSKVPDFKIVNDVDYNRCFSGEFSSRADAEQRLQELVELGFIDAFIVKFKGNERVLF